MRSQAPFRVVPDIPYYTEPREFYVLRMSKGINLRELRSYASMLFEKPEGELTVEDYKLAFLHRVPFPLISTSGNEYRITVKKCNGRWTLACNCKGWIYSSIRKCKHTEHVRKMMENSREVRNELS